MYIKIGAHIMVKRVNRHPFRHPFEQNLFFILLNNSEEILLRFLMSVLNYIFFVKPLCYYSLSTIHNTQHFL